MGPVDVVILTKNSGRILEKCLTSIYRNVPVKKLIVVDGYSTDNTLDVLHAFSRKHGNIKVIQNNGTRATARQIGIKNVETDWFMFVDSDVVLCRNWFEKAIKYINENVGAICGIEVWSTIHNPSTLKIFLWITRKIFDIRGGTHDILIRRDAVKDIKIPDTLHVFEDAYIKESITEKGYEVVACYDPYCLHYRPLNVWTVRGSLNIILDSIKCGSFKMITRLVPAYGFYTAYTIYQFLTNRMVRH